VIRHVFRLVWNRKRSTGLILVEILACFLVLCGILATAIHLAIEWRKPLGFDYENVWAIEIGGMEYGSEGEQLAADRQAVAGLLQVVRAMPEAEAVATSTNTPYSTSTQIVGTTTDRKEQLDVLWTLTSEDLPKVLRMTLLYGRWVEATDGALGYKPVVLTRKLARDLFGTDNPVGREIPVYDDEGNPSKPKDDADVQRVVGVMDDYRRRGMLSKTPYTMFQAVDLVNGEYLPRELLVRVRPGTTADFEERLVRGLQSIAPQWSYDTTTIEKRRRDRILGHVTPLVMAAVVAVFLIVMVGLGLVGVLWLSVTRRTAELGLRRAMGASGVAVRRQVVGELWALTAIAVSVGAAVFLQLPLFGANFGAGWPVFLGGTILATGVVYGFVTICGLYPAWLATRVQPATALQYE
jgi:putative ABC transport system permease protein